MKLDHKKYLFMKTYPGIIFFTLAIIILSACSDEDKNPDWWLKRDYWGEVSEDFNGVLWDGAVIYGRDHSNRERAHPGNVFGIDNYANLLLESLGFHDIPCEVGKHTLYDVNPNRSELPWAGYHTAAGDVLGDYFTLFESEENFIDIISIEGKEVTATFQLTLLPDTTRRRVRIDIPDTLRFTNGFFHTRLNPDERK